MISYQTDGVEMPAIKKRETTEWIKSVAATYGKRTGEIAYIFCSDEKILEVNRQSCSMITTRTSSLSTIAKETVSAVTSSSALIPYAPMRNSSPITTTNVNCTVSSSTASSTFAASMTKGRENGRLWRRRRIRRWRCGNSKE